MPWSGPGQQADPEPAVIAFGQNLVGLLVICFHCIHPWVWHQQVNCIRYTIRSAGRLGTPPPAEAARASWRRTPLVAAAKHIYVKVGLERLIDRT